MPSFHLIFKFEFMNLSSIASWWKTAHIVGIAGGHTKYAHKQRSALAAQTRLLSDPAWYICKVPRSELSRFRIKYPQPATCHPSENVGEEGMNFGHPFELFV